MSRSTSEQCPTCLEAHEMLTRALIAADNNADGDLLDKIHDAIEVMERAAQPPKSDEGWRAAYQLTVAGPAGLLAQLESERARRIAAEARLAEPPAPEWQPIETAPKDETQVLLWWSHWSRQPCIGYFDGAVWCSAVRLSADGGDPVAWMPLPSPPTKESAL